MTDVAASARHTPLYELHVAAGGRMVDFAGWDMPIQYSGVIEEHTAVRTSAGLFDVSHMGQLVVEGPGARLDLQRLLSNDIDKLTHDGMAQYTLLTNEQGGIEDDLIVYREEVDRFLLIVNAANTDHDREWLMSGIGTATAVRDVSDKLAMFALQGPSALDVLADLLCDVRDLHPFRFVESSWQGGRVIVATTGYTGERGCEILVPAHAAASLWTALAADDRVTLCGLGARDTLRLEVCYPLHGSDIGPETSAVAAGLGWVCGWSTDFVGRASLRADRENGTPRTLAAVVMAERGIPRANCELLADAEVVGLVSSGTMSPSMGEGIALAWVDQAHADPGTSLKVDIRGKVRSVRIVEKPIYRKETVE